MPQCPAYPLSCAVEIKARHRNFQTALTNSLGMDPTMNAGLEQMRNLGRLHVKSYQNPKDGERVGL
jgi:hypothetical protein